MSVAVVAPEMGREGERVRGFERDAVEVEAVVLVASSGDRYGFRRPSEPPLNGFGMAGTAAAMSSMDLERRFFERERERDRLRKSTS